MLLLDKKYQQNMQSNYMWIIDAGHGGLKEDGTYTTAPAKMFKFSDGLTIYEGVLNRIIADMVYKQLEIKNIDFAIVYDEVEDLPLSNRVITADNIFRKDKRAVYMSLHSNAGGGSGFEIFTSPGQTKSDKIANIFCEIYMKSFPDFIFRKELADGDADKEADFYVLRKTDCPSILLENLFFDNRRDADFLNSKEGQKRIADCIVQCIETVEKMKPI